MARPLRIEFPGALYHVTSRGDRRESIFEDDDDRMKFLAVLREVVRRFNWRCYAYCLMDNHYHLVIETPDGNLSKGMRLLNGMFTQASNRRHARSGHIFQGRFKAILVDKQSYFLEVARYVVLNPVRAGLVTSPARHRWNSFRATAGEEAAPDWLDTNVILANFGQRRGNAQRKYAEFVRQGKQQNSIWANLRQQIFLGDDKFVGRMQKNTNIRGDVLTIPHTQRRRPAPSLDVIFARYKNRNEGITAAYETGTYTYRDIAEYLGLHLATIGRIIRSNML